MRAVLLLAALLFSLTGLPAMASDKEIAALEAVFAPAGLDTGLFADSFLAQVPPAQITAVVAQVSGMMGPLTAVTPQGGQTYLVETATYEMAVDIVLDPAGKISGLFLHPPVNKTASLDELLKEMAGKAPQSAYLVVKDGQTLAQNNATVPMAVGSAYKLAILKALKDEIAAGAHRWDEVARLGASDISLPSGQLQNWPVGAPLTLHSLAALMISNSDNTASDMLMRIVGRDKVEAALGIAPALTTREVFTLKADAALKAKYLGADEAGKRAVLAEIDAGPVPDVGKVLTPYDKGVEWEVPLTTLCTLIEAVGDLDVTQINAGAARKDEWARVSFKGGSEIGVLSAASLLLGKDGARYCVAATWNGPAALDEATLIGGYAGVLHKLAKG